ncbi:formyltransferase family protein [Methylomicrobium sp. Wu6]|uniref:methionyl-tRNA formyltransferase n=1 Tax=Methylomicrobium sp. Wu6 TaxID=3107928 RepID=UPI002DD6A29B|nr:formyltransferase family protein [Methylomicrobium sp. Wu6]MEC4749597.1 formyltransferase family protein [Methylomicrobium sp. Wu6]
MTYEKKLVAIGRSRFLYDSIKYLVGRGFQFKAIITEEAYEEYDVKAQDFEALAAEIGATIFVTKNVMQEELFNLLHEYGIRLAVSVNWKYTLPLDFLNRFECGILNFHLGNLPDYKGNATVNWSIINGEDHIYGNIHRMEAELDVGDVLSRKSIPITSETYVGDILKQAEKEAPALFEIAIETAMSQPGFYMVKGLKQGLRCYPRLPEDNQINWQESIETICRLIRASSRPYQGAFSNLDGKKVIIWKANKLIPTEKYLAIPGHVVALNKDTNTVWVACRDGFLEVLEIEVDGRVMAPFDYIKSIRTRFK